MTTTQTTDRIGHELGLTGRLTINGVDGSVDLVGTDGSEVVVHGTGRRPLEADFTVRGKPDDLKLTAIEADGRRGLLRIRDRCQAIRVEVPRDTGDFALAEDVAHIAGGAQFAADVGREPQIALGIEKARLGVGRRRVVASGRSSSTRGRCRATPCPRRGDQRADGQHERLAHHRRPVRGRRPARGLDRLGRRPPGAPRSDPGRGLDRLGRRPQPAAASRVRPAGPTVDRARDGRPARGVPVDLRRPRRRRRQHDRRPPAGRRDPPRPRTSPTCRTPTWPGWRPAQVEAGTIDVAEAERRLAAIDGLPPRVSFGAGGAVPVGADLGWVRRV
jgi:hypothetical protein